MRLNLKIAALNGNHFLDSQRERIKKKEFVVFQVVEAVARDLLILS